MRDLLGVEKVLFVPLILHVYRVHSLTGKLNYLLP